MSEKKLSGEYISGFCRELGMTIQSGMTISDGIFMLCADDEGGFDRQLLQHLYAETEKGISFSSAVKKTGAFPQYAEEMLEIGEKSGHLDSTLLGLSKYYTRQEEISRGIKNAVVFPSVLLTILVVIIIVLLTQVLPIFEGVFEQLGVTMSATATALMNIGTGIMEYSAVIIGIIAVLVILSAALYRVPSVRRAIKSVLHGTKLKKQMSSAKFAGAMAMTLSSGMDIDDSLGMAKKLCDAETAAKIDNIKTLLKNGKSFDKAVSEVGMFSAMNSRRLTVSFKTGNTDKAMEEIAADSEMRLNEAIDEKISRIEPTLVVIMSMLVGLILFSVMLPMMSVITSV